MQEFRGAVQHGISKVYCNKCGREIITSGEDQEDYLEVAKRWGYFSNKDLVGQAFNLCESCYDQFVANFKVPVQEFIIDDIPMYTDEQLSVLSEAYAKELNK